MSFNKTVNLGSFGIFILMIALTIHSIFNFKLATLESLLITSAYFVGSLLIFISLYGCFKYTEKSKIACKINLIGVFALIPLLAFDILSILGALFPILPTLFTSTTLRITASIVSYVLLTLFLFSIYSNHTSSILNSILYKAVIAGNLINLTIIVPYSLFSNNTGIFSFSPNIQQGVNPFSLHTIGLFIFVLLICITYKGFLTELKLISENTNDSNICKPI